MRVGVGVHAAVSGGAAACSLCLQLLWHCFASQAAEVNTIMELALPALPRGPAGWTHTGSNRVDAGHLLEPHFPINRCRKRIEFRVQC